MQSSRVMYLLLACTCHRILWGRLPTRPRRKSSISTTTAPSPSGVSPAESLWTPLSSRLKVYHTSSMRPCELQLHWWRDLNSRLLDPGCSVRANDRLKYCICAVYSFRRDDSTASTIHDQSTFSYPLPDLICLHHMPSIRRQHRQFHFDLIIYNIGFRCVKYIQFFSSPLYM